MRLELKHLAPYLPYRLMVQYKPHFSDDFKIKELCYKIMKTTLYILAALLTIWFVASIFINQSFDNFVMNLGIYSLSVLVISLVYVYIDLKDK